MKKQLTFKSNVGHTLTVTVIPFSWSCVDRNNMSVTSLLNLQSRPLPITEKLDEQTLRSMCLRYASNACTFRQLEKNISGLLDKHWWKLQ